MNDEARIFLISEKIMIYENKLSKSSLSTDMVYEIIISNVFLFQNEASILEILAKQTFGSNQFSRYFFNLIFELLYFRRQWQIL